MLATAGNEYSHKTDGDHLMEKYLTVENRNIIHNKYNKLLLRTEDSTSPPNLLRKTRPVLYLLL